VFAKEETGVTEPAQIESQTAESQTAESQTAESKTGDAETLDFLTKAAANFPDEAEPAEPAAVAMETDEAPLIRRKRP
jgi:hypothetical protein